MISILSVNNGFADLSTNFNRKTRTHLQSFEQRRLGESDRRRVDATTTYANSSPKPPLPAKTPITSRATALGPRR